MRTKCPGLILAAMMLVGCGGAGSGDNPPSCFKPQPGEIHLNRDAIYVANTGSSTISAFQHAGDTLPAGPVCGSPFHVDAPPTALGGGMLFVGTSLLVLSQPQKSISLYSVDFLTSVLTGPRFTVTTPLTPVAVAGLGGFFYVANAEGGISVYGVSAGGTAATELQGSPFPTGAGPVAAAVAAQGLAGWLYVANSQSNDVSGYSLDPNTGVPTPLPGSPYPVGDGPASVAVDPAAGPNPFGARIVIVANKLSNDVSVFSISGDGSLTPAPGSPFPAGSGPTSAATGNGAPLAFTAVTNSKSNDVSGYTIDNATGALTPVPGSPFPAGAFPSSAAMSGNGNFLYVANSRSNNLSVFATNPPTGALTPVAGSPFAVGQSPQAVLYVQVPQ